MINACDLYCVWWQRRVCLWPVLCLVAVTCMPVTYTVSGGSDVYARDLYCVWWQRRVWREMHCIVGATGTPTSSVPASPGWSCVILNWRHMHEGLYIIVWLCTQTAGATSTDPHWSSHRLCVMFILHCDRLMHCLRTVWYIMFVAVHDVDKYRADVKI